MNNISDNNNNNEKFKIINIIIVLSHLLIFIIYLSNLLLNFNNELRIILFDISLFIGGLKVFIHLVMIIGFCFGLIIQKLFYLTLDVKLFYWTKLFDIIDRKLSRNQLDLNESHDLIIKKLNVRKKQSFYLLKYMKIIYSKYL